MNGKDMGGKQHSEGSVTIEAAIAFPALMLLLVLMFTILQGVYTYIVLSNAMSETVKVLASSAYYLHFINDMEDEAGEAFPITAPPGKEELMQKISQAVLGEDEKDGIMNLLTGNMSLGDWKEKSISAVSSIVGEYSAYLKGKVTEAIMRKYLDLKYYLQFEAVYMLMDKQLQGKGIRNDRLKYTYVQLPLSDTAAELLSHDGGMYNKDDVVLCIEYAIPFPFKLGDRELTIRLSAVERGWVSGLQYIKRREKADNSDDIWSKDPLERGRFFKKYYKSNLPFNFPTIDRFENGTVTCIDSMDVRKKTYQDPKTLVKTLHSRIDKLASYQGQPKEWAGIKILPEQIRKREYLLVIPAQGVPDEQKQLIQNCVNYAASKGVVMVIKEY